MNLSASLKAIAMAPVNWFKDFLAEQDREERQSTIASFFPKYDSLQGYDRTYYMGTLSDRLPEIANFDRIANLINGRTDIFDRLNSDLFDHALSVAQSATDHAKTNLAYLSGSEAMIVAFNHNVRNEIGSAHVLARKKPEAEKQMIYQGAKDNMDALLISFLDKITTLTKTTKPRTEGGAFLGWYISAAHGLPESQAAALGDVLDEIMSPEPEGPHAAKIAAQTRNGRTRSLGGDENEG